MRRFAVLLAVTMTVLSACGSVQTRPPRAAVVDQPPSASDIVAGRFARAAELDNGAFRVAPAPRSTRPTITEDEAAILSGSDPVAAAATGGKLLGFGLVTVRLSQSSKIQRAPAWVALMRGAAVSCPAIPAPERPGGGGAEVTLPTAPTTTLVPAPTPGYVAVVMLDARRVFDYRSRESICGEPPSGPTFSAASETFSLPWKPLSLQGGKLTFRYQVPSCFAQTLPAIELDGNTRTGRATLTVELTVPFDRANCPATWKQMTTATGPPPAPNAPPSPQYTAVAPAPVGPIGIVHGAAG